MVNKTVTLPNKASVTDGSTKTATLDVNVLQDLSSPTATQTRITAFPTETISTFLNNCNLPQFIQNFSNFLDECKNSNVDPAKAFPIGSGTDGEAILTYLDYFSTDYNAVLVPASQLTYLRNVRDGVQQKYANESDTILTQLNQKKKDLDEAKTRYEAIKDPEQKVGYYEGWFPIFRPMKESSLFGIFGAGLFLLLISIFMFLNMNGVSVSVELPVAGGFELPDFSMAGPWAIGGLVVGGVGAYLLYKYT